MKKLVFVILAITALFEANAQDKNSAIDYVFKSLDSAGLITRQRIKNTYRRVIEFSDSLKSMANVDNTRINVTGWGDSMTAGAGGQTTYGTYFASKSGYIFDNQGIGGETSTQIKTRMLAAPSKFSNYAIIWAGRNNKESPNTVLNDIAAMVTALGHNRYLVISVCNGAGEGTGTSAFNNIASINNGLSTVYGVRYLDVRSYLVSKYNPLNSQDSTDNAQNIVPASLRIDAIHFTSTANQLVADLIYTKIATLIGTKNTLIDNIGLNNKFATPPPIGTGTTNTGSFSTLKAVSLALTSTLANGITLGSLGTTIGLAGNGQTIQINQDIVPNTDNTRSIGIASQRYNNIRVGTGASQFDGSIRVGTFLYFGSGSAFLQIAGNNTSIQSSGDIIALTNDTKSIGIPSQRFNYASIGTGASSFLGTVAIGGATITNGSQFDVQSTTKVSIPFPKMTTTQRDELTVIPEGGFIYNLTTHMVEYYNGSVWKTLTTN